MSSHLGDQELVKILAEEHPEKVIPAYGESRLRDPWRNIRLMRRFYYVGLHPWWSHHLSLLPSTSSEKLSKWSHYSALFPGYFDSIKAGPASENDAIEGNNHQESQSNGRSEVDALYASLPEPIHLDDWIEGTLNSNLESHTRAMLGEVGLDKAFRLPVPRSSFPAAPTSEQNSEEKTDWQVPPSDRKKRAFTNLKVPMGHQVAFLRAQLEVAFSLSRNVSFHSVQAQGPTVDLISSLGQTSPQFTKSKSKICMHSYGGSAETIAILIRHHPKRLYFSFSTTINARLDRLHALIQAVPKDRLLVESDYNDVRGQSMKVWEILGVVCEAREWTAKEAVEILAANWECFSWVDAAA